MLQQELDITRLTEALALMRSKQLNLQRIERPTPFAFPLLVERFRESFSSEKLADRISRMVADLEKAAGNGGIEVNQDVQAQAQFGVSEPKPAKRKRVTKDGSPMVNRRSRKSAF